MVDRIVQDVRYGTRSLRQSLTFSLTTIAVIAIGIAASTTMFAVANAWLLRPLPLERPAELVSVWRTAASNPREPAFFNLYRDYLVWAAENHTTTGLAATFEQDYALTGAGDPRRVHGAIATWNLFDVVGGRAIAGRLFQPPDVDEDPSCVISYALWWSQFGGSADTIGRSVRLNDKAYRVIGVLPQRFSLRILDRPFDADVWTLIVSGDPAHTTASLTPVAVIGRLKPGGTVPQVQAELGAIQEELNRQHTDGPPGSGVLVAGLQQDNTRTVRSSIVLVLAAVGVLLLVACVNAGSLVLGRHVERTREFAVRLALGCSLPRLLQQLTIEILLLFVCGAAVGVGIASLLLRVFVAANPLGALPPGGISIDRTVLVTAMIATGVTALLFGSIPAFHGLRRLDADALRARTTPGRSHLRSRMWFVGLELALSVVLLVSAGLLISTFARIASEPPGFDTRSVYVTDVALPLSKYSTVDAQARFADGLLTRLRAMPSVESAAVAASWPFQANGLNPIDVERRQTTRLEDAPQAFIFTVGASYFNALGIPVLRGREFTNADQAQSSRVAVINDAMARRAFPDSDPIGQRVRVRYPGKSEPTEPWLIVVGVVSNTRSQRYNHVDWDQAPAVYSAFAQRRDANPAARRFDTQTVYIYVRARSIGAGTMAAAVHAVDVDLPVGPLRTSGEIVSELRAQPRMRAWVLGGFAFLTVMLALVGVYGVMTQFVQLRRREMAIRIALGAVQSHVIRVVIRRALVVVIGGLVAGVLGALAAGRLLNGLLYGVSAVDPLTFVAVVAMLATVSIVASYLPARAAAAIDPNDTLRCE